MTGLRLLGLAAALAALLLPAAAPPYLVAFSLQLFMYVVLASSWNIVSGFTGYTSFGHVAFFGIGAYTAAILITRLGAAWPLAALAGGALALLLGLPVGAVCLRLKGPYFAIAMLGFAESLRLLATLWTSLTKGGTGITLPPIQTLVPTYYAMLACVAAVLGVSYRIATSSFGLRLLSIREDEQGAEHRDHERRRERARIEDREREDRENVVHDRERGHEDTDPHGNSLTHQRENPEREGDVRRGGNRPAALGRSGIQNKIDRSRGEHASQRGDNGQDRRAAIGEGARRHLAADLEPHEKEENGQQAFRKPRAHRQG